jgi:hypothetical protein
LYHPCNHIIDYFTFQREDAITSIESVDAMTTIAQEKSMLVTDPDHQPDPSRPEKGIIQRCRKGLPLALN